MPTSFPDRARVQDLNEFLHDLQAHIADQVSEFIIDTNTDRTSKDDLAGYERTFEIELTRTGIKGRVIGQVNNDDANVACMYVIVDDQTGSPSLNVSGTGTNTDVLQIIESIRTSLNARKQRLIPELCPCCGESAARLQPKLGTKRYRCDNGHEFVLRPMGTVPPNVSWTHELEVVVGDRKGCSIGDTFPIDTGGIADPIIVKPAPKP